MGADFAYIGSAFIATDEARAVEGYKRDDHRSPTSDDIVYSNFYTGVHGNYLKGSIQQRRHGPRQSSAERPQQDELRQRRRCANAAKAWKDIWGCGQGIGAIREVVPAAELVARFKREYAEAKARICAG